jgi:ribosome-associated translation inhibitor RaiA
MLGCLTPVHVMPSARGQAEAITMENRMKLPLQISFRGMDSSPALERRIRIKVAKLERFHDRLMSCAVVVDARTRRQHKGKVYRVGVDLRGPGFEIAVGRSGRRNSAHEDITVALRDAFAAIGRQLEDHARIARGNVKAHRQQAAM